jgi:hypothetical protein
MLRLKNPCLSYIKVKVKHPTQVVNCSLTWVKVMCKWGMGFGGVS